jgi:hypothetical protein
MDGAMDVTAEIRAMAELYCQALHHSDVAAFEAMLDERFFMTTAGMGEGPAFFDRTTFIERVRNRPPFNGLPAYEIFDIDIEGNEMAHVKLSVDMPPRRFHDYLGFFRVGGEWKLVTKLFRTASENI